MKLITKLAVFGIILAGLAAPVVSPAPVQAQASEEVIGRWDHYFAGGLGRTTMHFNANGTYQAVLRDIEGRVIQDSGTYEISNGVMFATGKSGERVRMYFFWVRNDIVTIRMQPVGSTRYVDATFSRLR